MKKVFDKRKYELKVIELDGVTCVSVNGKNPYNTNNRREPSGELYPYKDKKKKRFQILKKLGLWENGKILPLNRKRR
jgi:hypothetical protein